MGCPSYICLFVLLFFLLTQSFVAFLKKKQQRENLYTLEFPNHSEGTNYLNWTVDSHNHTRPWPFIDQPIRGCKLTRSIKVIQTDDVI